jgi:hypothetical protein
LMATEKGKKQIENINNRRNILRWF